MAIFSKHDSEKPSNSVIKPITKSGGVGATIIASGTKIKGDLTLSASLHIDGEIEGIIHSDNLITIGPKGRVNGEIITQSLVINGVFTGSAKSNNIEILSKGNVKGKLTYAELTIEKGASFEGETSVQSTVSDKNKISDISSHQKADTYLQNIAEKKPKHK
ncbi:MAG: polymer-forming cytoskeletal protein [Methylococcales bacterium]|nr:polymer-forming cytoskeletal protein [Methylococcales bacterium]